MPEHVNFAADLILTCNSLGAGGIERVVSTLANEWSRRGRKVCVITMHDRQRFFALDTAVHHIVIDRAGMTWLAEYLRKVMSRFKGFRLQKSLLVALLGAGLYHLFADKFYWVNFNMYLACEAWALRRALRRVDSPVVVALGTSINIITLKACRGLGRRVIISERTDPRRLATQKTWDWIARSLYQRADLVTANTRTALSEMRVFVEPEKLAFLPNPLTPANGRGHGNDDAPVLPQPFFLTIGRLVWDKAHDVLLEAFALLGDELEEWRLAIVGEGRMRARLKAQAESLGVLGRVHWYGVVQDPYAFYRAANIFVLPSRVEGTPNALLEAMSCGLPVVVSDGAPGPLELVEDGVTGLVVPVNDATALAIALRKLATDHQLCRRLGEAARARVSEYDLPHALVVWESVVGLTC